MSGMPAEFEDLRVRTRAFIRDVVIPAEPHPGEFIEVDVFESLREKARAAGVFTPQVPKEYGGGGVPLEWWSPIFQEAGYSPIGPSVINCMAPDEGNMYMLEHVATEEQKEKYLRPLAAGVIRTSFAMTEPHPGAGSDPEAMNTVAHRVEGGWSISGVKRFISGATMASYAIVMVRTDAVEGAESGATMLMVPMDAPGITIAPDSIHSIDRAILGGHPYVRFENVFAADEDVIGAVGQGFRYAQVRLGPARLTHCMRWLGLARRSLDIALDRVSHRDMFGSRLADLGLAQDLIATSVIDIETSDAIISRTAVALTEDPRTGANLSSIAKVHTSEAVNRVIDRAMQLCGGDGMTSALPLASYMNEVRPFRVYDGSTETHKWAISRRAVSRRRREREAGAPRLDEVVFDWEEA